MADKTEAGAKPRDMIRDGEVATEMVRCGYCGLVMHSGDFFALAHLQDEGVNRLELAVIFGTARLANPGYQGEADLFDALFAPSWAAFDRGA